MSTLTSSGSSAWSWGASWRYGIHCVENSSHTSASQTLTRFHHHIRRWASRFITPLLQTLPIQISTPCLHTKSALTFMPRTGLSMAMCNAGHNPMSFAIISKELIKNNTNSFKHLHFATSCLWNRNLRDDVGGLIFLAKSTQCLKQ